MSNTQSTEPPSDRSSDPHNGHRPRVSSVPGVADLGAFRGRTVRSGVPILPPGWRPDRDESDAARPTVTTVVPVARPAPTPPGGGLVVGSTSREVRSVPSGTSPDVSAGAATTTRVLRRVRPWSVLKMTLAFQICMVAVVATAGAIVWAIAVALGVLDNVEGFVEDMGFESFAFDGGAMLRAFVVGGLLVAVASALMATVLATMFNLLSDITGGIEAETAPARVPRRERRRRRRTQTPTQSAAVEPPASQPKPSVVGGEPVAAPAVAVSGADGSPDLDLTDDHDGAESPAEVDHIQLAIDDLLRDEPPANGTT